MASEFKLLKSLEWCVQLPYIGCPRESPVFLVNNTECMFRFVLEERYILEKGLPTYFYSFYLEVRSNHTKFKPFTGKLQVGFKKEQILSLGKKNFMMSECGSEEIWCIKVNNLQPILPTDYMDGNWIKYVFFIDDDAGSVLRINEGQGDKCLQTSSYLTTDVTVESIAEDFARLLDSGDKCLQTSSYLTTDVTVESIAGDFTRLLDSGPNHDAEIKCGEHSIKAHKIILSARSDVFKAMLASDMLEGRTGIVVIEDIDINYVRDLIRYLYTGSMPDLSFDEAKILYEAGDKYAIRSLMLRCSEFLQDNLSPENVFDCFELADKHSDQKLQEKIKAYLLEKKIYLQRKYWLPFCENFPKTANEIYLLSYETSTVD